LFLEIKKYAPDFSNPSLAKEEIWKKLFPDKKYNYGFFKNIIYDITKLVEHFLQIESLNSDKVQQLENLLKKLSDKKLESIFTNKYNSFERSFFKSSKFYGDYYRDYLRFKYQRFVLEAYNPKLHTKHFSTEMGEMMIIDFFARFSIHYNSIYIEETEFNELPANDFLKNFSRTVFGNEGFENCIKDLARGSERKYKHTLILFKLMKSYINPQSIECYFEFRDALFENDKYFSESALRGLYANLGSALDNCDDVQGLNKNKELYEIVCHLIDMNIFTSDDGKVIPSLYQLTVKTAGYLKKSELIEKIINDFIPGIDPDLRENFRIFSIAFLCYSRDEFDKSLEYSNLISIDSFQLKYILKNLQIIISYEKNDYEMFLYLNDAYKHFLSKNKSVSTRYRNSNMKFLNYINLLFKLRKSRDKVEIGFMEKNLLGDVVVNKYWMLEKLDELKRKL
jgi:hypothetical protein